MPPRSTTRSNARRSGHAPSVCTVSSRGARASAPSAAASARPRPQALASAPPPTWTTRRSIDARADDELPAERLAALDGEPVQVALAGERERALGERLEEPVHGRVAGDALARAGRRSTSAPSCSSRSSTARLGVDRDEHAQTAPPAAATTAAASAALPQLAIARSRRSARALRPSSLGDLELEQDAEQVPRLVRAGDVAGLVLDPDAAGSREAEPVAELVAARERRDREAVAVDRGDAVVEPAHERAERLVADASVARDVVGVEERPVADERVRLVAAAREPDARSGRARGGGRGRRRPRRRRSGSGTDTGPRRSGSPPQPAQTSRADAVGHTVSSTPVRALNSSISSSQPARLAPDPLPEAGLAARLEVLDRDALLLDPGEVAEVEDARCAPRASARAGCRCVAPSRCSPKTSPAATLVEAAREVLREREVALAARTSPRRRSRR